MLPSAIFFMLVGLSITHWDSIWSLQVLRCWSVLVSMDMSLLLYMASPPPFFALVLCVRDLSCLVSVYPSICMRLFWLVLFSHVSVRVIT